MTHEESEYKKLKVHAVELALKEGKLLIEIEHLREKLDVARMVRDETQAKLAEAKAVIYNQTYQIESLRDETEKARERANLAEFELALAQTAIDAARQKETK